MYVETMLKAMRYHLYSAGLTFGPDFDKSEIHINRSYRIQNGIARRYTALQAENARLKAELEAERGASCIAAAIFAGIIDGALKDGQDE